MCFRAQAASKFALLILFVLLTAFGARAQAQPAAQSTKQTPITTRSEVVLVPTVVTDKSGAHVADLAQGDFSVLENGQPQEIAFFQHVKTSTELIKHAAAPDGEATNSFEGGSGRVTIFVLDFLNSTSEEQRTARDGLVKFLSKSLVVTEPVCLIAIDVEGVKVINDFTTDPALLVAAVKNLSDRHSRKEMLSMDPDSSIYQFATGWHTKSATHNLAVLRGRVHELQLSKNVHEADLGDRVRLTLEALREIGEGFAGVPGRKSLIWATGGFPFEIDDPSEFGRRETGLLPLYESAWQALNRANIAIYPLDEEDLVNPAYVNPAMSDTRHERFSRAEPHVSNLEKFAEATGGNLCDRRTDALACFQKAAADSSDYYLIGYYENSGNPKPGWRKLSVKVTRPGLQVHARAGYFAHETQDEKLGREEALQRGLTSPIDYTGVHITVRWTSTDDAAGKKRVGFQFILPPGAVTIDLADKNHINVDFLAFARTTAGATAGQFSQNLEAMLNPQDADELKTKGAVYSGTIDIAPGTYALRFLVRDNLSGEMGTLSVPLSVPEGSAAAPAAHDAH